MLSASGLTVSVNERLLVEDLSLDVAAGEVVAVLGKNGAGKTLTLKTLAALREPDAGEIRLHDRTLAQYGRRELARELALLPQDVEDVFPSTVTETAQIGRHPYLGLLGLETAADRAACRSALSRVGLNALAGRDVQSLSGGERRRVAIAQILCQSPSCYLLDEPLNHLDPQHQLDVLEIFRELANDGAAVLAALHDVNLARRFADRALVLYGDGEWHCGPVADLLVPDTLSRLYGVAMEAVRWRDGTLFVPTAD